jgi:hypothetical protein
MRSWVRMSWWAPLLTLTGLKDAWASHRCPACSHLGVLPESTFLIYQIRKGWLICYSTDKTLVKMAKWTNFPLCGGQSCSQQSWDLILMTHDLALWASSMLNPVPDAAQYWWGLWVPAVSPVCSSWKWPCSGAATKAVMVEWGLSVHGMAMESCMGSMHRLGEVGL